MLITSFATQIEKLPSDDSRKAIRRSHCLNQLDEWVDDAQSRIACLVAPGGYGKTTVVRDWLQKFVDSNEHTFDALLVHTFYGQVDRKQSVVDIAIDSIYFGLTGRKDVSSSRMAIAEIIERCQTGRFLVVLDGLETQQDKEGFIDARSLLMDALISGLAAIRNCKILITSRTLLRLLEQIPVSKIEMGFLSQEEVQQMLLEGTPQLDKNRALTIQNLLFAKEAIPLTVTVLVDILNANSVEAYAPLVEKLRKDMAMSAEPLYDICASLVDQLPRELSIFAGAVAVTDAPISQDTLRRILPPTPDQFESTLASFSKLTIAIDKKEGLDLHPRVKQTLTRILEEREGPTVRSLQRAIAKELEELAHLSEGRQRLSLLYRALSFYLKAGDLGHAIMKVYLKQISGEPDPPNTEKVQWEPIRKDFGYRFEADALAAIIQAIGKPPIAEFAQMRLQALYRMVLVSRAMGLLDESDESGKLLSEYELSVQDRDTGTTGQIALTQMIRGQIDSEMTKTWCERAEGLAHVFSKRGKLFPLVRAKVYWGAYYHRLDRPDVAKAAFAEALQHQAEWHALHPNEPSCLVGVPAYLYAWFLIECGDVVEANEVVRKCREYLKQIETRSEADATTGQFSTMADITEAWVAQELALSLPPEERRDASRHLRRSRHLLDDLSELETRESIIPFDLAVTYVRAQARQAAIEGHPGLALEDLHRNVNFYERRGAQLFAADCQADIVRIIFSEEHLARDWRRPTATQLQAELKRLDYLARDYPKGTKHCFTMPKLRSFDLT